MVTWKLSGSWFVPSPEWGHACQPWSDLNCSPPRLSDHDHLVMLWSHHIRIFKRRLIQKSSLYEDIILLNLMFVVVLSWVKKFSLTPRTGFLFHGIDMKSEASGIPISHNNKPAAKPSHEVLCPNRNNPRPFILIRPVAQPSCRQSGNIVQWPAVASWQLYTNVQVWVTQLSWLPDIATNLMMDGFY